MSRKRNWLADEFVAASNVFRFTDGNSDLKTIGTIILVITWSLLELITTATDATPPTSMWWIRIVTLTIVARTHGIKVAQLRGET